MKKYLFSALILSSVSGVLAQQDNETYQFGLTNDGLLPPARHNAYGPGIESDATGQPFHWVPKDDSQSQQPSFPDPTLRVVPDGYGLGVGRDQYGRPMERRGGFGN